MYIVVGGNSFLGSYIIKNILSETEEDIIATARDLKNVKQNERIRWEVCDVQKDADVDGLLGICRHHTEKMKMVYLAAFHHPDEVQKKQALAWDINVTALSKFLNKLSDITDAVYYASTDSVYGESEEGYHFKESDKLNPVNFYGHCKCAAESLMIHKGFKVLRFPFLISPSLIYKKHFYDEIRETLAGGNEMEMYNDSYRSAISFDNAGYLCIKLIEKDIHSKIINVCGDMDYSKYDVGIAIAQREGLNKELIKPVSMRKMQKENFQTKRAVSTLMDNSLLKTILGISKIGLFDRIENSSIWSSKN